MLEMWKSMLDKTDEMGKRKGNVGDLLCGSLNENLKHLKKVKEQNFKRQAEIFQLMISEVLESVKELTNVRKNFLGARGIYLKFKVWYVDFKFFCTSRPRSFITRNGKCAKNRDRSIGMWMTGKRKRENLICTFTFCFSIKVTQQQFKNV